MYRFTAFRTTDEFAAGPRSRLCLPERLESFHGSFDHPALVGAARAFGCLGIAARAGGEPGDPLSAGGGGGAGRAAPGPRAGHPVRTCPAHRAAPRASAALPGRPTRLARQGGRVGASPDPRHVARACLRARPPPRRPPSRAGRHGPRRISGPPFLRQSSFARAAAAAAGLEPRSPAGRARLPRRGRARRSHPRGGVPRQVSGQQGARVEGARLSAARDRFG